MSTLRRACILGHPVSHSRSPLIHNHWLATFGIPGAYEAVDVPPDSIEMFLRSLGEHGFVGGNVTLPHKEAAFRVVERRTGRAERLRAVNTVWYEDGRLCGDNTDIVGFLASVDEALGPAWADEARTAVVLGAGGAARAVVAGLVERGLERIVVANRTVSRAADLLELGPGRVEAIGWDALAGRLAVTDLLINTTSLGMKGQPPLDLDLDPLPSRAAVADIVYVPLVTPLLRRARERKLRTVEGLGMLLHQAVPGFAHWFGRTPEVTPELRALVEADVGGERRA